MRERTYTQAWSVVLLAAAACATLEPPPSRSTSASALASPSVAPNIWVAVTDPAGDGEGGNVVSEYAGLPALFVGNALGALGADMRFGTVDDLAAHGDVLAGVDVVAGTVFLVDAATRLVTPLPQASFPQTRGVPTAVAFDSQGNLLVGYRSGDILKLNRTADGFASPTLLSTALVPYDINAIAWDEGQNEMWVVYGRFYIARLNASGTLLGESLPASSPTLGTDICGRSIADLYEVASCCDKVAFTAFDNFLVFICDRDAQGLKNCKQVLGYGTNFADPWRIDFDATCQHLYVSTSNGSVWRMPADRTGGYVPGTSCSSPELAELLTQGDGSAVEVIGGVDRAWGLAVQSGPRQCVTPACSVDGDCAAESPCGFPRCVQGTCQVEPKLCNTPGPCEAGPGFCSDQDGSCSYSPVSSCTTCTSDANCNDNNACTTDTCTNGACLHAPIACAPKDACHAASCDPATGCVNTSITCSPKDACHSASCDPKLGCVNTPIANCCLSDDQCADKNACTADKCENNACVNTPIGGCCNTNDECGDGNACTTDACVNNVCTNTAKPNCCLADSQCGDNNACTTDACVNNVCVNTAKPNCCLADDDCNDGNACTTDACVNNVCANAPGNAGVVCRQASGACDIAETCTGTSAQCPADSVQPSTVVCRPAVNACDAAEKCDGQTKACPTDKPVVCNDNDPSTNDTCDPVKGCVFTPPPSDREGCTPGYWKNHRSRWCSTYRTTQLVSSIWPGASDSVYGLGSKTLLQALSLRGGSTLSGAAEILLRAGVAALLNGCRLSGYPRTTAQVISQVASALASRDRATILDVAAGLDRDNNLGCPLN